MYKSLYEVHVMNDPMLPFIFHKGTIVVPGELKVFPNWHTNVELLNCTFGEGTVVLDGRNFEFHAGDTVCVNTNVIHGITAEKSIRYDCLIVDSDFCTANGIDVERMRFTERFTDDTINRLFGKLICGYSSESEHDPFRNAKIRSAVLRIMIELCERYTVDASANGSAEMMNLDRVKKALNYIHNGFSEPITLDDIARHVGISRYYLSRTFRAATGFSVFEYINNVRCREAKLLIESGCPVSEAAQICGFENMSYFTRTFKRCIGILPSKLRVESDAIRKE